LHCLGRVAVAGAIKLVELYENYQGRQLHVFAEYDALVPYQVMQKTKDLAAKIYLLFLLKVLHMVFHALWWSRLCK
jgi:hypothetical protein